MSKSGQSTDSALRISVSTWYPFIMPEIPPAKRKEFTMKAQTEV